MMALAFLAGLWTASRRGGAARNPAERRCWIWEPWLIIGSILGARTLYVVTFWREQFAEHPFPTFSWFGTGPGLLRRPDRATLGCIFMHASSASRSGSSPTSWRLALRWDMSSAGSAV